MKAFLRIIFCLLPFSAFSINLFEKAPLTEHLIEVNPYWQKHKTALPIHDFDTRFATDELRIKTHLTLVERLLRNKSTDHLSEVQVIKRHHHLDQLQAYTQEGVFPTNNHHNYRIPYFIDDFGVHCAVGYLLFQDQQCDLIKQIHTENNYDYIATLAMKYPIITEWAFDNGFEIEELAFIQPSYSPSPITTYSIGNNGGCNGTIYTIDAIQTTSNGDDMVYFGGSFSEVDGVLANNIIGWDGSNWITFGEGLDGVVYDIVRFKNRSVAVGDFVVPNDPTGKNIAYWDDSLSVWVAMQHGDMGGFIKRAEWAYGSNSSIVLIAAGKFSSCNGDDSYENIAAWSFSILEGTYSGPTNYEGKLSSNGPINDLTVHYQKILFVGDFTETSENCVSLDCNNLQTNNLAYWDNAEQNWVQGFLNDLPTIEKATIEDSKIVIAVDSSSTGWPITYVLDAGLWYPNEGFYGHKINGFVRHYGEQYAYGDFGYSPLVGKTGNSLAPALGGGMFLTNGQITAADDAYGDVLYLAGDFTNIFGASRNNLAFTYLNHNFNASKDVTEAQTQIYASENKVIIKEIALNDPLYLTFYDVNGYLLHACTLYPGFKQQVLEFEHTSGLVVYKAKTQKSQSSGKLVMIN